jgi:hypothetical protein
MSRLGAGLPVKGMAKASLVTIDSWLVGGLSFKYNPEQFSFSKSASWDDPGISLNQQWAPPAYLSTSPGSITMEIFFDAFEELMGDVTGDVKKLIDWTKPGPSDANGMEKPPLLQFRWGASQAFQGMYFYLQSVNATYTMFRADGTPIRATCNITLIEATNPANRQNPTSGSRPGVESHVLKEGESLHSVAWARYGQAGYWRALAAFNGIDDPLRVEAGTRLLIPPRRDAAALA